MIVEIKIANYRSINAEQTLSFVAERGTRHPDNVVQRPGYKLLKAVGLFGANASGKSNFVQAIGEMREFVQGSATKMNDGAPIVCAQPFRLDAESREKPSRFEVTFVTEGVQYVYGFAATRKRVHEEWLSATPENGRKELMRINRSLESKPKGFKYTGNGLPESVFDLLVSRTRDNALFLSTAARENVQELLPAFRYFNGLIWHFDMIDQPKSLQKVAAENCLDNPQIFAFVRSVLRDADTGIEELVVESERVLTTRRNTQGKHQDFNLDVDDSTGTQRLFTLAGLFYSVLDLGVFLAIDELDASMHPLLTRKLLKLFQSAEANPKGAQLLFTTHDPSLLDQDLFRRDQIWLAEKFKGASSFYSLADIKPAVRNTESFLRNYLAGRYGGTPHLGPALDGAFGGGKA